MKQLWKKALAGYDTKTHRWNAAAFKAFQQFIKLTQPHQKIVLRWETLRHLKIEDRKIVAGKIRRLRTALREGKCDGMDETQIATVFDIQRDYLLHLFSE